MPGVKQGDKVRVYPHGSPHQKTDADVVFYNAKRQVLIVHFDTVPPFAIGQDTYKIPDDGIMMTLSRPATFVPWIESKGGGHYEIEEVAGAGGA